MDLVLHRWYLFTAREARESFNDPSRETAKEKKWLQCWMAAISAEL